MGSYASYAVRDSGGNIIGYQSAYTGQIDYEGTHTAAELPGGRVNTPQPAMSGNTAAEIAQLVGKTGGVVDPSVARIAAAQTATPPSAAQEYDYDTNVHPALPPTMYRAVETRPGYYASTELGDTATQTRAKELMNQPNKPFGSYDDAVRYTLEEQRQAATDSRAKSFYENELTKSIQEPIEAASQYHYMAKETGRAISANPYEYQADLAVELLKGAPVTRSDVFSPVSGEMSKYLPGGAMGVQQHQWNTALGKNENVNFMPGLAALQAAEGIQGPYGALYGGTGVKSITPESVGNVMAAYPRSVVTTMSTQVAGVGPDVTVKSQPMAGGLYVVPGSAVVFNKGGATGLGAQQRVETSPAATWLEAGLAAGDALTSLPSTLTGGRIQAWTPGADLLKSQGLSGSQSVNTFQKEMAAIEAQRPDYDAILSDVQTKTAQLNTLTEGKINEKGEFAGTQKEYEKVLALQSNIKTGTDEYNKFNARYQNALTQGYSSGAIIKSAGDTYQIAPETERKYGAFSDWSTSAQKLITGGMTPSKFAIYETTPEFAAAPWYERVGEGFVKTVTNPEEALQSGIQGVALYAGTAGLGAGLGALSKSTGVVGTVAGGATKIGESPLVKYGVPAVFLGAGTYGAAEGVDIGGPTLVSPKAGWVKFESNLGALGGNLAWMGVGAMAPGGLAKASTLDIAVGARRVYEAVNFPNTPTVGEIGSGVKGKVSDTLYSMKQRAGGIENIGPESGLSYYKAEPVISKIDNAGKASSWMENIISPKEHPEAQWYSTKQGMYGDVPLIEMTRSPETLNRLQFTNTLRTTEEFGLNSLRYAQEGGISYPSFGGERVVPGRTTDITFNPIALARSGEVILPTEAWTGRAQGKRTVSKTENIVVNPYTGEGLVISEAITKFEPSLGGKSPIERKITKFNIYSSLPDIMDVGEVNIPRFPSEAVTKLSVTGGKNFLGVRPSVGVERIAGEVGRVSNVKAGININIESIYPVTTTKPIAETSRAIGDIIGSEYPELISARGYLEANPKQLAKAEKIQKSFEENPIQLAPEESPAWEAARQFRAATEAGKPAISFGRGGDIGSALDILATKKQPFGTMGSARAFRAATESKNKAAFEKQQKTAQRQQLILEGKSPMSESFKKTWANIQKELKYITYPQRTPLQRKQLLDIAIVKTKAERKAAEPLEIARLGLLEKAIPSERETGKIVDTSGYIKYSEAMLKGLKESGAKVGSIPMISGFPNRVERQYGRIDNIGLGVDDILSPSQKSLQKQSSTEMAKTTSEKSMSDTIQKSIQDILKISLPIPAEDTTQKTEEALIRVPSISTILTPSKITTQTPRQTPITDIIPISDITPISDIVQTRKTTTPPPPPTEEPKIPVIPPLFGGGGFGGGGVGAGPRKRYKKHVEVFSYPFTPALAAVAVTKALRRGSNVTRGPASSLPSFSLQKPTKVQQKPVKVVSAQRAVQQKVASIQMPSFSMPNIGIAKKSSSTTGIRSISLPSSLPQKKKRK